MKIKKELLQAFLDKHKITAAILARDMGVAVSEIETLLNSDAVDQKTARQFIYYFGANEAAKKFEACGENQTATTDYVTERVRKTAEDKAVG